MARKTTTVVNEDDESTGKPRRGEKHLAVWLLVAMIVTGFGGWGVANFGRNVATIGKVGGIDIPATDYAHSMQASLRRIEQTIGTQVTFQQAQQLGLDRQVLQGVVLRTALDAENARLGLSVGNQVVAKQVEGNQAFNGGQGFDRQVYKQVLKQNGLNEKSYEAGLRADTARQILVGAVKAGFAAPAPLVDAIYAYRYEKRGFSVLQLTEAGLPDPVPAPTDKQIKAYYDAHVADFTRPKGKRITYAALLPDNIAPTMKVKESDVKALYDSRSAQYHVPAKRQVDRLVYPTEAAAKAARARLDAGTATFADLVKARGLAVSDIDMGDVSKSDLGKAGDAVFALKQGEVAGPLPSSLGPALYRVTGVTPAKDTPFEAVKAALTHELQVSAAKDAISNRYQKINDDLAAGATLEDLAKQEPGMTLATTDYAPGATDNAPITADSGFAKEAAKVEVGDYPEAVTLDNGGIVAMRDDEDLPAAPIPLDKVKDKVVKAWHADALHKALVAQADTVKTKVAGGAELAGFGVVTVQSPITRSGTAGDAPAAATAAAFALKQGGLQVVATPGWVGLVKLDSILPAPTGKELDKTAHDKIAAEMTQGIATDLSDLYGQAILGQEKVTLDQAAINAVNASFH